mmetsp:Transcript_76302/g.223698  ORF Transcript_76302/g.223698 Transcript_76302/m.223698 type:complete len:341 (+) Transcript_76302:1414-2436(+)
MRVLLDQLRRALERVLRARRGLRRGRRLLPLLVRGVLGPEHGALAHLLLHDIENVGHLIRVGCVGLDAFSKVWRRLGHASKVHLILRMLGEPFRNPFEVHDVARPRYGKEEYPPLLLRNPVWEKPLGCSGRLVGLGQRRRRELAPALEGHGPPHAVRRQRGRALQDEERRQEAGQLPGLVVATIRVNEQLPGSQARLDIQDALPELIQRTRPGREGVIWLIILCCLPNSDCAALDLQVHPLHGAVVVDGEAERHVAQGQQRGRAVLGGEPQLRHRPQALREVRGPLLWGGRAAGQRFLLLILLYDHLTGHDQVLPFHLQAHPTSVWTSAREQLIVQAIAI